MSLRGRLLFILAVLVIVSPAIIAAEAKVRLELSDAAVDVPSTAEIIYPSIALNQNRVPGDVSADYKVDKDIPPPPCEPAWHNGYCMFSSTSACKVEKTCEGDTQICLDNPGTKCYTYKDAEGNTRCKNC